MQGYEFWNLAQLVPGTTHNKKPGDEPGFNLLFYFFFSSLGAAAFDAAAGAAFGAVASSCFNWRVITTEAIGIRGLFNISILSTLTSSTRMFPLSSRLLTSTVIDSFRSLG